VLKCLAYEYLAKYSIPEEAAKHSSEAVVSLANFEEAVKKIRTQREMKPEEKLMLSQYVWSTLMCPLSMKLSNFS
jgi:transitional endoplasmic reticulum ATPase